MSCLQKICTIRSQILSACLGSLTRSLFALYGLNEKQILKLDGIYSEDVLYWEMWLLSLEMVRRSVKKRDLLQKAENILKTLITFSYFLKFFSIFV